jgi:serine/threonine protein kinase/tetratricopeptide (TPR) repeat protein
MWSRLRAVVNVFRPTRRTGTPQASWPRIGSILGAALELPPDQRRAYVERECGQDARLRGEVLELVAAGDADSLLDRPVDTFLPPFDAVELPTTGTVATSARILQYELLARVPGGGMGVIYKARDTRLQRTVALKCLPGSLSGDAHAKSRFLLEARAAAALDHRHVCTIHEIGETRDGQLFIAMPFYDGETVADRVLRGPVPMREAVDIARQVAEGLAHAHERGMIHRDIKPANVMITAEGVVKILDFGIVKLQGQGLTRTGAVVGTVPYMSPERLRGEEVDARTDIWSLGVVLYEMLAGRRPFDERDDRTLQDAIWFAEPASLTTLRPEIPDALSRFVSDALAKHPADRPASASVVAWALDALRAQLAAVGDDRSRPASDPAGLDGHRDGDPAQVLPEGEHRQATIAIANLSGYAELVERSAPHEVDEVIRRLKRDAWNIAERHGGIINEFSEERIVLLFGVPVSREDHCARAARAALDLRAMVRELRDTRPAARRLALHIAIDSGESAVQRLESSIVRYRIAGRPIRRAAQLCAHARTDEILLSPETGRAVGSQFVLTPSTPLPLEDGAALAPFAVVRDAHQDRLDQMVGRGDLTAFTGRETELATLTEALADAASGRGRVITVSGEAGVGKSRLLLEFRRTLDRDPVMTLIGRCSSYGQATPYIPFVQALRQLLRPSASTDALCNELDVVEGIRQMGTGLEPYLPYYLRLLSISSDTYRIPGQVSSDQARIVIQEALVALLVAAANRGPLVLMLEDWHWVDAGSHETLQRLVDLLPEHRLLVLATTRTALGADWHGDAHRALKLRPLAANHSTAMLHAVLGASEIPADLGVRLYERTGGNPFFLEEIARSLIEAGTIRLEEDRARLVGSLEALRIPATVQAVIRARLDRLDLEVRQVLRVASVVGRDFTREILARVLNAPEQITRGLDTLTAAGIIRQTAVLPEPSYTFRHALSHETAYAGLLEHQRADLHARVGMAIEELSAGRLGDRLDRLAQHFSLAENWPKAVDYGLRAAERNEGLEQYVDALRLLDRTREWATLLDASPRHEMLVEILFREERMCDAMGLRERQRQILDELVPLLESAGDQRRLAEAYLRRGELLTILGTHDEAERALAASLRLRRDAGDVLGERATLRGLGFLRWSQQRYEDALTCNQDALRIDRQHNRLSAIIGDLHNLGSIHTILRDYTQARACFEEALEISEPARDGENPACLDLWSPRVSVLYAYGCLFAKCGELDRALEYLGPDGEWRHESQHPRRAAHFNTAAASVYLQMGRFEEGLVAFREVIEITRKNRVLPQLGQALHQYGETLMTLGRDRQALEALAEAVEVYATLTDRRAEAESWSLVAGIHERLGNVAEAQAAWERTLDLWKAAGERGGEVEALEALGRVARRHLPSSVALRYVEDGIARSMELGDVKRAARLHNSAGIIEWTRGRHEQALAHFEHALQLFEALGDDAGAGQMMNSIAVSLSAMGRRSAARERLEHALSHHQRTRQSQLEAHALAALGDVCWDSGETQAAAEWYQRSLVCRQALGDRRGEAWMLQRLARSEVAAGASTATAELLARADALSAGCGDEELIDACEELRRAIGASAGSSRPPAAS